MDVKDILISIIINSNYVNDNVAAGCQYYVLKAQLSPSVPEAGEVQLRQDLGSLFIIFSLGEAIILPYQSVVTYPSISTFALDTEVAVTVAKGS